MAAILLKIPEHWRKLFRLEARQVSAYIASYEWSRRAVHEIKRSQGLEKNGRHFHENHWTVTKTFSSRGQAGNCSDIIKLRVIRTSDSVEIAFMRGGGGSTASRRWTDERWCLIQSMYGLYSLRQHLIVNKQLVCPVML